jgi:ppGpp synthetase/RelA/SpoT-type nucleotidyltranferase
MPVDPIEEIRLRWLKEKKHYVEFCKVLDSELKATLRRIGISATVTSRSKEIDSLVRKVIKQQKEGRHPAFESIVDKVGLRAVVRFAEEVDEAVKALETTFNCLKVEYKSEVKEGQTSEVGYRDSLKMFGYRSCHMDITLPKNHESYSLYPDFPAELQVRTLAQDLWAVMAHELSYKSILRDVAPARQDAIDRRIYILSALIESADMEFSRMNGEIMATPGAEIFLLLRALEREYFKYTSRQYDRELSLQALKALAVVHPRPVNQAKDELSAFSERYAARLRHIFSDQANNPDRSAFLFQPESIFIFECLATRQLTLEEEWEKSYPANELQRLASVWGIPVFD